MERLVSVREVAHQLGCSDSCVWKWVARGVLPSIKVGTLRRIREQDLEDWVRLGMGERDKVAKG